LIPPVYADTSALAKLFLREAEGPALDAYLDTVEFTLVSSELTEVELARTISKTDAGSVARARELLSSIVLLPITSSVRKSAGDLPPRELRSLDAIHLSTALEIKSDLSGFLTYDSRLAVAAERHDINVLQPGSP
jgi:predicted nucleic acid-binding protein